MATNKHNERYDFVPVALRGKFPNGWIVMLQKNMRIAAETTFVIVSFFILYATIVGPPYRSEWIYLLTASIGPGAVAVWYIIFPLNPYRTMSAIREGMRDKDKHDLDAKELVVLLKSPEAQRFLLNKAWQLSFLFTVPMAIISAAMHRTPIWRFGADCLVRIPAFILVCLFMLFRLELLAWALAGWKNYWEKCQTRGD